MIRYQITVFCGDRVLEHIIVDELQEALDRFEFLSDAYYCNPMISGAFVEMTRVRS
jgi:hypothetical protein